jgi:hypothetical protein
MPGARPGLDGLARRRRALDVLVRRQVDSATAPETRPRFDVIPTGERTDATQAQILKRFSLQPGPSDVTSVHDFNVLRIAFEHVWGMALVWSTGSGRRSKSATSSSPSQCCRRQNSRKRADGGHMTIPGRRCSPTPRRGHGEPDSFGGER